MAGAKKLVIIDGKSVFYRGYYAMPNLSTKDGTPTGGVYGFAVMALEVLKKFKPDYVVVAWDKPKTNIRRRVTIYPEYKANRKPAPPDFYEQVPVLNELIKVLGWPFFEIDDHEADDIMATLARQAYEQNVDSLLITSDHDVLQLVNGHTSVANLKKGLTNIELYNEDKLKEIYKLTPQQFVDYKALKGDPSDNIPGVAGVGDKTAVKLIHEYRSLDGVYQNIDKISGSLKQKLINGKDMAFLTRELVILDENVPVKLDLEKANVNNVDKNELNELLTKLEFRTLIKQLPPNLKPEETAKESTQKHQDKEINSTLIYNKEDLDKIKLNNEEKIALYSRTTSANFGDVSHIFISSQQNLFIIDLSGNLEINEVTDYLKPILTDKQKLKIGFNIKSLIRTLLKNGSDLNGPFFDTQIGAFLLNPLIRDKSLTDLAKNIIGYEGPSLDELPPMDIQHLAPKIMTCIWSLYKQQIQELDGFPKLYQLAKDIDFSLIAVLAKMEHKGIKLDSLYLEEMSRNFDDEISDIEQLIYGHAGKEFNISSPAQLATILYDELKLPTQDIKKGKNGYSTAASELNKLRLLHPIINLISDYREYTKLKNTYVDTLPKLVDSQGHLHTNFSMTVVQTGRLSSSDPNLQNIPVRTELGRKIRQAFVANDGNVFISADYSQFELRLAAVLANDYDLIESFNEGLDIHTRTAAQVYGVAMDDVTKTQRRSAKVINFGVLYGMSPHGLSVATGMTHDEAKDFIDRYFRLRQPILDYIEETKNKAKQDGFVETMFGRRRPTPDVNSSNFVVREAALRQAVNMPIQGTEADLMKMAMIKIDQDMSHECDMLLQIHDSILIECPEWKAKKLSKEVKDIMENIYKLPVNLDVDIEIGKNWGEL